MKYNSKVLIVVALLTLFNTSFAKQIHVAKNGNNNNAGTELAPYLTISKAAETAVAGDIVIIHEGTYEESVTPANSGTNGAPIIYKGATGEKVIITGMQALSNWTLDQNSIYKTQVDWDLGQDNFVMHNQTALDLARWPNNTDGDIYTMNSLRNTGGSASDVATNAYLDYSGIPNIDWSKGGSVHFYGDKPGSGWTTWRSFIKSSTSSRITFDLNKNPAWIRTFHAPGDKGEFFLQGAKGALDYKNEWYFDGDTKTLYVQLPGGAAPADGEIKMRKRVQAFNINDKNFIEVHDLAILGGSINIKGNNNKLYQVSSFYGNWTLGVVSGFSTSAISVKIQGQNNTIEKSEIAYGAGNGVYDSGNGTKILNSYIHHFNSIGNYDAVLNARGGSNSTYKNNILRYAGRDIIQAFNKNSEYAYNDVSFSNLIADDCALIYTVGGPSNSTIHHNWFHDAYSHGDKYKAAGIYLDNDASSWDVHHNVVWNTEWTNVQINWSGTDINIFNNTLVKGKATMGAWHKEGTAFSNVKVWNNITASEGENAGGQESETTWEPQSDKKTNLVDVTSFVDFENNDYHLKSGAQAIDYGTVIPGVTDGFVGNAPDVGAYEYGGNDWVPGVTWDIEKGPTGTGCYNIPGEVCTDVNVPPATREPFGGTSFSIPGIIQSEDYDKGGEGLAYHDVTVGNTGGPDAGAYRNEDVDIEATKDTKGAYNVGWLAQDEWLTYSVNVTETSDYDLTIRAASGTGLAKIRIELDGVIIADSITIPTINNDYHSYSDVVVNDVALNAGEGILKVSVLTPGLNLNYIEFSKSDAITNLKELNKFNVLGFSKKALAGSTIYFNKGDWNIQLFTLSGKKILQSNIANSSSYQIPQKLGNRVYIAIAKPIR